MFPTWWRNLVKLANDNGKSLRRGRRKIGKARRPWQPNVELLEDRLVPAPIPVVLSIPTNFNSTRERHGQCADQRKHAF